MQLRVLIYVYMVKSSTQYIFMVAYNFMRFNLKGKTLLMSIIDFKMTMVK